MTTDNEQTTLEPCPWCRAISDATDEWGYLITHKPGCYWTNIHGDPIGRVRVNFSEAEQWNTRVSAASTAPVVDDRSLYSELIHIAAELVRGDGFLSTCAEDMNPRLKRADILKTAEGQEQRLKDWAYRVRQVADKLSPAAASPAAPADHDSCPHWREGDSDNCMLCGDDLGPTTIADVATAAPQEDAVSALCAALETAINTVECASIDGNGDELPWYRQAHAALRLAGRPWKGVRHD